MDDCGVCGRPRPRHGLPGALVGRGGSRESCRGCGSRLNDGLSSVDDGRGAAQGDDRRLRDVGGPGEEALKVVRLGDGLFTVWPDLGTFFLAFRL